MRSRLRPLAGLVFLFVLTVGVLLQARTAGHVTTPKEQFGFDLGDDYFLANYKQLTEYWKKLDQESDRMTLVDIGETSEGRRQLMAIITSPENHKKLARYKEISQRLAHAEDLTEDQAHALATEGKAVVWIDGGLHASEVLGAQQLMELVYEMVSRSDPETMRFLNDVILLATQANPDGQDLCADWYMREKDPQKRSLAYLPRLYSKYVGHDDNRDSYMSNIKETTNMNRQLFVEWIPQIMYNHHQTGPTGTVLFAPPFRDPFNYNFDPLIPLGIDMVGAAMHSRFAAEHKPGATMRKGTGYSTWWNGGLRTTVYFHNMIGLLTETIGNPTPMTIPFVPQRQLANGDLPYPIAPQQTWHFKQSVEYSMTANRAVLDIASRYREQWLYNIYVMGKNSIAKGSTDTWTVTPKKLEAVNAAIAKDAGAKADAGGRGGRPVSATAGGGFLPTADVNYFNSVLRDPAKRDPRGYILPSDQPDFLTATKFMNTLIKNGITVHRATAAFSVGGKQYPAGSYVVKAAQAFRPHVMDMFEPQDHPNDFQYPGGPPIPPYDITGWTLSYQMGVKADRILDAFDGPFEKITGGLIKPTPGAITGPASPAGYLLTHAQNDAFVVVNRLMKSGDEVYWLKTGVSGQSGAAGAASAAPGTMYIPARPQTQAVLKKAATDLGVSFVGVASKPDGEMIKLKPVRIGLWDTYGGSMPSGWTRWLLEQYEFPFEVVFPPTLDAGNLKSKYDVLIFVDGGIPTVTAPTGRRGGGGGGGGFGMPSAESIPGEYRPQLGSVTAAKTVPQIKTFLEEGGTVLAIGSSTSLVEHLNLPLTNALVDHTAEGDRPLPQEKFYVPGSLLQVSVDNTDPLAYGMEKTATVFFDSSEAFKMLPDAPMKGVRTVAWFDTATPLLSGWAWGQHYLEHAVAIADANVGKGKLFVFGPEIAFRAQPHGTFKLLFNGIYYGPAYAAAGATKTATPTAASAAR
jgi:hypothetical protein